MRVHDGDEPSRHVLADEGAPAGAAAKSETVRPTNMTTARRILAFLLAGCRCPAWIEFA